MKREIKFRGKSIRSDKWCYGNLFIYEDDCDITGYDIFGEGVCDWNDETVDSDTIGQFTGLKDKNGKEIYEGDILGCANPKIKHLVFYNERQGRFMAALNGNLDDDFWLCGFDSERWNASKEIIGNIYDNPELLTEK